MTVSSIFLRIYGGLLFSLVLVSLLSGITVSIVNSSRLADYRESMVKGTLKLVAEKVTRLPEHERQSWLDYWGHRLSIPFSLVNSADVTLSDANKDRLHHWQVVINMLDDNQALVYTQVEPGTLLKGQVDSISEAMMTGTMSLLQTLMADIPEQKRFDTMASLQEKAFSYQARLLTLAETGLKQPLLVNQLRQGNVVTLVDNATETITLFGQIHHAEKVIQLGPVELLNPYPPQLVITIGLFVLLSLSLTIYTLVRGIERRLRKLERAAKRFSGGDFAVRVNVSGADSIGSLAMAFNDMAGHIERLLGVQKEMIRGVSHELRTPVARLRFALEMIADAESVTEREMQLAGMDKDIVELDTLVDEFLTYANLEQGAPTLRFKRLNVDTIAAQVVSEHLRLQSRIQIEHLPCSTSERRQFSDIDPRYLHRAIQNLVGNACRYADTRIQVKFSATQDNCRIDVDDDGPGIPKEQWERVFTAFSRLDDSRTRKSGGYGLGLSIVQRIMYWHNGRAKVSHSPLGGAQFSLIWPRKQK